MKTKLFSHYYGMCIALLLSSCVPPQASQQTVKIPADWPTIKMTESTFRKYFDDNTENLNLLEGIWSMTEGGTWRNVYTGMNGTIPSNNPYRIAIIKDSTNSGYDFVAVVLESEKPGWMPGRVKARFRNTAYEKVFDALWFSADYSSKRENYIIDESGIIKNSNTSYNDNIEVKSESILLKAYPIFAGKPRPIADKNLKATGSGFLLTTTGLVVTNYHVVEDANKIEIVFPEKNVTQTATVRIKDTKNDIAILEIKDFSVSAIATHEIPFCFADVNSIKVGQEVFTLGFPLGDIMGSKSRLSTGRINSQYGIQDDPRLFQISNPLQPGNSGGPLFNNRGELIGIVVSGLNAKYFYENTGIIPQNVNFAIKASYLQSLISMTPEGDDVTKRKNSVKPEPMENQIEQLNPFVVQVRIY